MWRFLRQIAKIIALAYPFAIVFGSPIFYLLTIVLVFKQQWYSWLIILYLIWMYLDRHTPKRAGRPINWVADSKVMRIIRQYLKVKLLKVNSFTLKPHKNYLFCIFPHGIVNGSAVLGFQKHDKLNELFPQHKIHIVTLNINFYTPFLREYNLGIGAISAEKSSIKYCLNLPGGGHVVVLVVGGSLEAEYSVPDDYTLVLKNRKGFVKIALETGAPFVPVFGFNETKIMHQIRIPKLKRFSKFTRATFGFPTLFMYGRFLILPYKVPLTILVGEPIEVVKNENPTQEEIDNLHALFVDKLTKLFEENKHKYIDNADKIFLNII